jgi:uncharacterized protein (TIGR03000 family)
MFGKLVRTCGALALAAAVLFLTPRAGEAAGRGGGFHGGGFHGGGVHAGSFHGGGFHYGSHGLGFAHPGYGYHAYGPTYGSYYPRYGSGYAYPSNYGYGYYPYYSYGYYPYYGGYSTNYATSYSADPALGYGATYPPAYDETPSEAWLGLVGGSPARKDSGSVRTEPAPNSTALSPAGPSASPALLTIRVPVEAEVRIDGQPTTSTGTVREYRSPPLKPGFTYSYDVQARWQENGRTVTQTHRMTVSTGSHASTTFPSPSAGE